MQGIHNFNLDQASDYTFPIQVQDANGNLIDFTGSSAVLKVREHRDLASPVVLTLSTPGSGISISTTTITVSFTASQTTGLAVLHDSKTFYYDLKIVGPSGAAYVLLSGKIVISFTVSQ